MDIKRVFNTVKYMNNRQIYYRIKYEISKRYKRNIKEVKFKQVNYSYKFRNFSCINEDDKTLNYDLKYAKALLNNEFTFLNRLTWKFEHGIEWEIDIFQYRLWNFNLNYFDYLEKLSLAYEITNNNLYISKGINLIKDWISKNYKYNSNTWDPYVVAKRVYNWINFISFYKKYISKEDLEVINTSIYTQGKYLSNNVEYYLDANHVIMDGKGIIFCGVYFSDASLFNKGFKILLKRIQ